MLIIGQLLVLRKAYAIMLPCFLLRLLSYTYIALNIAV